MKRFIILIVAVLFTLLFLFAAYGLTVSAQDVTAEPTVEVTETPEQPTEEPTPPVVEGLTLNELLLSVLGIGFIVIVVFLGRPLILQVGTSVPGPVFETAIAAKDRALEEALKYAMTTPTKVDDETITELKNQLKVMEQQIRELRARTVPQ